MSKVVTWVSIMGGVTMVMYLGGMIDGTASSTFLDLMLNPQNIENSELVTSLLGITTVGIGILAGLAKKFLNLPDYFLLIPFASLLFSFMWDFMVIFQQMSALGGIQRAVTLLIFGPIVIMYVISVIEWWRGIEA